MMLMDSWFDCFRFNRPLSIYISSRCLRHERERSKQRLPAPTASIVDPILLKSKLVGRPGLHVTQCHQPATRLLPDAEETVALQMGKIFLLFPQYSILTLIQRQFNAKSVFCAGLATQDLFKIMFYVATFLCVVVVGGPWQSQSPLWKRKRPRLSLKLHHTNK